MAAEDSGAPAPACPPPAPPAPPPPVPLVVLCTIVAGLVLAWLSNFFDSDEILKRLAARSFAPLLTQDYGTQGQARIAVVTIDDGDLDEYGLTWPVPLDFHQRLIGRIASHQPRAVFLDVVFLDDRPQPQVERLREAVCAAAANGVPFYYATYQRVDLSSNVELMLSTARTPTGERCAQPVRAPVEVDRLDQHQWVYPLNPASGPAAHDRARRAPSVALTLHCLHDPQNCPRDTSEPMALLWPTAAAASNLEIMVRPRMDGKGYDPICRGEWHWSEAVPFNGLARRVWHWVWAQEYQKPAPLCPYNQVVPASAFKGIGFTAEELDQALRERFVLIGVDLIAINDHVLSPVHGRLPGVHAHAVALDNLITLNGRYMGGGGFEWPWDGWTWTGWQKATLFSLASLCLVAGALVPYKCWQRGRLKAARTAHAASRKSAPFQSWERFAELARRHAGTRGKALRWLVLGALLVWLLAYLCSAAGGPGRLLILLPLTLALWMLLSGQPVFGRHDVHRLALGLRVTEVLVYALVTLAIVCLGFGVFRQGPLVVVEYVGLTALAGVLGWGETVARHAHAFWRALSDGNPVEAWNRHAAEEADKRIDP